MPALQEDGCWGQVDQHCLSLSALSEERGFVCFWENKKVC